MRAHDEPTQHATMPFVRLTMRPAPSSVADELHRHVDGGVGDHEYSRGNDDLSSCARSLYSIFRQPFR